MGIHVLRVAHDHHVAHGAVAIDVALVGQGGDDLTLVGAALASIRAHVADLVPSLHIGGFGLTVDVNHGHIRGLALLGDGSGGRGLNEVHNQHIHALG